jgi:hypothetical protein
MRLIFLLVIVLESRDFSAIHPQGAFKILWRYLVLTDRESVRQPQEPREPGAVASV